MAAEEASGQTQVIYVEAEVALFGDERALWKAARPVRCAECGALRPGRVSADMVGKSFYVFRPAELA